MNSKLVVGRTVILLFAIVGCASSPSASQPAASQASAGPATISSSSASLELTNATSIAVQLAVNGSIIDSADPQSTVSVPRDSLPGYPWHVEAQTALGRTLLALDVTGDIERTTDPSGDTAMKGYGARVDLSCGRIDLTYGPPLAGPPAAQESFPLGDCDP